MINIVKYNKRESNYHVFCLLLDYVKEHHPALLRNKNGNLRSPKEYRSFFDKKLNCTIKTK